MPLVQSIFRFPWLIFPPARFHVPWSRKCSPAQLHSPTSRLPWTILLHCVSGTSIKRPAGQILPAEAEEPIFSPCGSLDIELDFAAFVSTPNQFGSRIPIESAQEPIFGIVLMDDWSARDIQRWEYVPLGHFLEKNFGTTISAWIVLPDALEPFLTEGLEPGDRQTLLPYLREEKRANVHDIDLSVELTTKAGITSTVARTNAKHLLYSFPQMMAHHTVNGCLMRRGICWEVARY